MTPFGGAPVLKSAMMTCVGVSASRSIWPTMSRTRPFTTMLPASETSACEPGAKSAAMVGVAKNDSVIEIGQLEYAIRNVLNRASARRFGVLDPLKVVITNYPEGRSEEFELANHPDDPSLGTRRVPFSREIFIEHDDFLEDPPRFLQIRHRMIRLPATEQLEHCLSPGDSARALPTSCSEFFR